VAARAPRPPLPPGPHLVVGLARSGKAAAHALLARGERVIGLDAGAPAGIAALGEAGVELHTGEDGLELLERVGCVIKSPGVPREAPVIERALRRGVPVLGELELGWRLLENETIAVTGTNGKTTTVELIGHIHREAGLPVAVAGNVGAPLSGFVGRVDPATTIVCEASSFQLEDALAFAPEAAVLLNIAPDHLDRHGSLERYTAAKLALFARQTPEDLAVAPLEPFAEGLPGRAREVRFGVGSGAALARVGERLRWRGEAGDGDLDLIGVGELGLRGEHNVANAMAAAAVCLARGLDVEAVRAGLATFAGVAHRLEEVAREEGVLYVNDSKATNVASAVVALAAFPDQGVHLIAGGQGKGQDFGPLREPVAEHCRGVYLIGEDGPLIGAALAGLDVPVHECGDLEHALARARAAARAGEVVLLSPACASFDQFDDYEARGESFRELVQAQPHS